MSAVYACEATQSTTVPIEFVLPVSDLPSSVEAQTVPRMLQLQSSSLRIPYTVL